MRFVKNSKMVRLLEWVRVEQHRSHEDHQIEDTHNVTVQEDNKVVASQTKLQRMTSILESYTICTAAANNNHETVVAVAEDQDMKKKKKMHRIMMMAPLTRTNSR
jgi:hypothetical protein